MLRLCGHTFHSQFQTVVRKRLAALTVASKELSSLAANNNNNNKKKKKKEKNGDVNPNDDSSGSSISKRDDNGSSVEILYQRDPRRNGLPKASFLVSSMNSMYWLWYVFDFIPAVNASPIEDLHVDPIYGFGGLGLSILIQSVFTFYPLSLVSKIGYRASPAIAIATATADRSSTGSPNKKKNTTQHEQRDILVWKHTLPLLHTSQKPLVFPVGGITMDKTSDDTRKILEELGGDVGKFEGHLGLTRISEKETNTNSGSITINFPLLVDIRSPSEVYDSEMMLQTLLSGKFRGHREMGREQSRLGDDANRQRTKHRRKQGQRRKNRGAKR